MCVLCILVGSCVTSVNLSSLTFELMGSDKAGKEEIN